MILCCDTIYYTMAYVLWDRADNLKELRLLFISIVMSLRPGNVNYI